MRRMTERAIRCRDRRALRLAGDETAAGSSGVNRHGRRKSARHGDRGLRDRTDAKLSGATDLTIGRSSLSPRPAVSGSPASRRPCPPPPLWTERNLPTQAAGAAIRSLARPRGSLRAEAAAAPADAGDMGGAPSAGQEGRRRARLPRRYRGDGPGDPSYGGDGPGDPSYGGATGRRPILRGRRAGRPVLRGLSGGRRGLPCSPAPWPGRAV